MSRELFWRKRIRFDSKSHRHTMVGVCVVHVTQGLASKSNVESAIRDESARITHNKYGIFNSCLHLRREPSHEKGPRGPDSVRVECVLEACLPQQTESLDCLRRFQHPMVKPDSLPQEIAYSLRFRNHIPVCGWPRSQGLRCHPCAASWISFCM